MYQLLLYNDHMKRDPNSHKGDNGKVAIVGGSEHQHGAPLFSALAAERSGVDLLYVIVPTRHAEVAKAASLNFQVHPLAGDELSRKDVKRILELLASLDCVVIGPGLSRSRGALNSLQELIASCPCPMVLDASSLQPWTLATVRGREAVLTPHLGELERMGVAPRDLAKTAKEFGVTMHLKDRVDQIAAKGTLKRVSGGNAGLTHGGTGDALAGLIAGLIAQRVPAKDACVMAATIIKKAGAMLFKEKGYAYTTMDVIGCIPGLLKKMES